MEREVVIKKYEDLLLHTNDHFYLSGTDSEKEQAALSLLRYIITDLLGLEPQEGVDTMNVRVGQELYLDRLATYISYPKDIDVTKDFDYFIHVAFKNETTYDGDKKIIEVYRKVLRDERPKFPKNYFNDVRGGKVRARSVLIYAINNNVPLKQNNAEMLFELFADKPAALKKLKEWKISSPCKMLYDNEPLEYLYDTVEHDDLNEFLYNYYSFMIIYSKFVVKKRKK